MRRGADQGAAFARSVCVLVGQICEGIFWYRFLRARSEGTSNRNTPFENKTTKSRAAEGVCLDASTQTVGGSALHFGSKSAADVSAC